MLKVADFLTQLDEQEHLALVNNIGGGLHDARLAAQCVTEPGRHAETVPQLLYYFTHAIDQLEAARELVRRRA
jgi:hypothetical protein